MRHSPFAAAFTPGTRFVMGTELVTMSVRVAGPLRVPTGRIVVSDPGITDFAGPHVPLARQAPIGEFPVELALADFAGRDTRVACARVRFAAGPALRWEPAEFAGQAAGADGDPAYGVDCGIGCFFDAAARADVDEATMAAWFAGSEQTCVGTASWHVAPLGDANLVMFSSGWGDGLYTSYWGLDARGDVVELVTDFDLLYEPVTDRLELPLPLPRGKLEHPWLAAHRISVRRPLLARRGAFIGGRHDLRIELSDQGPLERRQMTGDECLYKWRRNSPGLRLVITVPAGARPLEPL